MTPQAFVERLGREKARALLRTNDQEKAALAMEAAIRRHPEQWLWPKYRQPG